MFSMKPFFLNEQKAKPKNWISWEQKELLRWNNKHFSSFLKSFCWSKYNHFLEGESPTLNDSVYLNTFSYWYFLHIKQNSSVRLALYNELFTLKRPLFRIKNYHEFSRFSLDSQLYRLEDTKRNVFDLADFRNQIHHKKFLRE